MRAVVLLAAVALAGCSTTHDPHAPKTVMAPAEGGEVTLRHGQRLRIPLVVEADTPYEWRRVEPMTMTVVAEGAPDAAGFTFTPVRTGSEKLVFEYRPLARDAAAQKSVAYDVTVR